MTGHLRTGLFESRPKRTGVLASLVASQQQRKSTITTRTEIETELQDQDRFYVVGRGLRELQERPISLSFEQVRGASTYGEWRARMRDLASTMQEAGYTFGLLDEDGESMVTFGGSSGENARSPYSRAEMTTRGYRLLGRSKTPQATSCSPSPAVGGGG